MVGMEEIATRGANVTPCGLETSWGLGRVAALHNEVKRNKSVWRSMSGVRQVALPISE